jgi:hypothetical protein
LAQRKASEMKNILGLSIILTVFFNTAQAEQFGLIEADDSYISLNECLYALSKGTKLSSNRGEVFIHQNQVWEMSFSEDQKYVCNLIGTLIE